MLGMSDGGAVYVLGGNATANQKEYINSIHNNVAILSSDSYARGQLCNIYYHDGGSSHWGDYDNMILFAEDAKRSTTPCLFFQTHPQAISYHNKTERLYIVGYKQDHVSDDTYPTDYDDPTNETPVGWDVIITYWESRANFSRTVDPETGAYTLHCPNNDKNDDIVEEIYIYRSFEDSRITEEASDAMRQIYDAAGSTFGDKYAYGTLAY